MEDTKEKRLIKALIDIQNKEEYEMMKDQIITNNSVFLKLNCVRNSKMQNLKGKQLLRKMEVY